MRRAPSRRRQHLAARGPRSAPGTAFGVAMLTALAGCGGAAQHSIAEGTGERPVIPEPTHALVPTVQVAPATGWASGRTPTAAAGLRVVAFASGLTHPRWLYQLPNGDVLVAETNGPPHPEDKDTKGLKGWFMKRTMQKAGSGVPSPERITLLRDRDGDGVAETRAVFLDGPHNGLRSPFGMALVGDTLYVANTDAVVRFPYHTGDTHIAAAATKLADLPAGPINHHWTKSLLASPDGTKLYVGVGSNSNAGENGLANETGRAAVWEIDRATGAHRVYASGLRNPVGLAWAPGANTLWVAVNERDELGSDLVPDYMTSVREGGFYGWPYSYFGAHVDARVKPPRPDLVATAIAPDYALGPHTASLGLAAGRAGTAPDALPARFAQGMFVGQHGSWNRKPRSGYRVIFVPFTGGRPAGPPVDVLTGFVDADGNALGRPVGVAVDARGALLVADDVGNAVWRVSGGPGSVASSGVSSGASRGTALDSDAAVLP